ncbi:ede8c062-c914-4b15-bf54-5082d916888c-CDS [Sclerotinia trifoliorum]|uniref:Ede8c062-c914-4b15-bf54-5082d916888c-CDS n=1 Tax=Sclerotinia trifoliorum TaxID=28548 RepID=A0A8H2VVL0_9HELO|nr:ede8c062-c914-4b15-bf54-5082d916888c-CDS [Sclerotinia trifoliorum]
MGRIKSKPIDTSKLQPINGATTTSSGNFVRLDVADDRVIRCTTQPPLLTFNNSSVISSIHEVHRRVEHTECIDFRSTWVSQCLLQEEEEWIASQYGHEVGNGQLMMKRTAGKNKAHAQQGEIIGKYMEPSDAINPDPKHVTNAIANFPKQVESPPVVDTINRLAGQMEGKRINGRMSLPDYWREDSHNDTVPRGRSGSLSTIIDVDVDDLEVREPSSSGGSEHYIAPSHGPHVHAPPPRVTLAVTTTSVRACVTCYERHVGCDRILPRCSACVTSNANCVYPDVSPPG